eukprot:CAMPEP_0113836968 /NCGR_PEP_ID=MMETSP0328-20130328/9752_1 /TAXON_ID=39455 /ORGANISM="Alexandrium minutum" /LENGTH=135 /DNA_ID=CAMNT_0000805397 /DNA_START=110 /DNA_END=517 /DNA_ORIENTATION=+ /assembly_acc=CAM_ASM_000350
MAGNPAATAPATSVAEGVLCPPAAGSLPPSSFTSLAPRILLQSALLLGRDEILEVERSHGIRQARVVDRSGLLRPRLRADGARVTLPLFEALPASRSAATPRDAGIVEDAKAQRAQVFRRAKTSLDKCLWLLLVL